MLDHEYCRPLRTVQNDFVQVLVDEFELHRHDSGVELNIKITEDTPTIWRRKAKELLKAAIPDFDRTSADIQAALDRFLLDGEGPTLKHPAGKAFPFRYASGGVLPIVRIDGADYFCLFYRDIYPIGWNIANGGSDNISELLDPLITMDRELREELIIIDPQHEFRFAFSENAGNPVDHIEFAVTRRIWQERFSRKAAFQNSNLTSFKVLATPIRWLSGPDSVVVQMEGRRTSQISNCFLNINALDFGIEVDRVAKISLPPSAILCDGEIIQGRLLDAPVGLFSVNRMAKELTAARKSGTEKEAQFLPDRFFFGGELYEGGDVKSELHRILSGPFVKNINPVRSEWGKSEFQSALGDGRLFQLCPVTLRIMRRFLEENPPREVPPATKPVDAFISFAQPEDEDLAEKIAAFLRQNGCEVYFSKEEASKNTPSNNWVDDILRNLEKARVLVSVASHPSHLDRRWPREELINFYCRSCYDKCKMIPFVKGFEPRQLPMPLNTRDAVELKDSLELALQQLLEKLREAN